MSKMAALLVQIFSPQPLQVDSPVWSVCDLAPSQGKAQEGLMYSRNL